MKMEYNIFVPKRLMLTLLSQVIKKILNIALFNALCFCIFVWNSNQEELWKKNSANADKIISSKVYVVLLLYRILNNVEHKMEEFLEMVELFKIFLNRIKIIPKKLYFKYRQLIFVLKCYY